MLWAWTLQLSCSGRGGMHFYDARDSKLGCVEIDNSTVDHMISPDISDLRSTPGLARKAAAAYT